MNYTFKTEPENLDPYKFLEDQISDISTKILEETSTFIYDTPLYIVATAVAGLVLSLIFPTIANICFGIVVGSTISRVVTKIVDHYNPKYLIDLKEQVIEINENYP